MDSKQDNIETEYSAAIQDIVSKPASWPIKYGTYMLAAMLVVILILSAAIEYNDVSQGSVLITTKNPIVTLKAKTFGEIFELLIKNGDTVKKNQVMAVLKTTAAFDDVLRVKEMLASIKNQKFIDVNNFNRYYPSNLKLGEIQGAYLNFFLKHNELLVNDSLSPHLRKKEYAVKQLENQEKVLQSKKRQLGIIQKKVGISSKNLKRSETLLSKGVISSQNFDEIEKEHLVLLNEKEILTAAIFQKEIELDKMRNTSNEASLNQLTFGTSNDQIYQEAYQKLKNKIIEWEDSYIITSPIQGVANSHNIWEKYQNVAIGDIIFSIAPLNSGSGIGIVKIPVNRFAKVRKGQKVILKLSTYPYQQYGHLLGIVSGMSSIPDQEKQEYTVFVDITSLITSHDFEINIDQQMVGKAQIVTEKLSLAERLFYGLRKIVDPNN